MKKINPQFPYVNNLCYLCNGKTPKWKNLAACNHNKKC